eukprot:CAMPEP_0184392326 /NCGR_PEP_ID=MMETSP0007-20130409/26843_1 /TAXON_ID=97485 /ORGANISM="Prymnesium parvum, Strain Texoma1" /LENGTH=88 /DNA_ID=CAMNT_0026742857 /DNA_START=361 /DNA_END=624 /DNA_ORIENTATION=-
MHLDHDVRLPSFAAAALIAITSTWRCLNAAKAFLDTTADGGSSEIIATSSASAMAAARCTSAVSNPAVRLALSISCRARRTSIEKEQR